MLKSVHLKKKKKKKSLFKTAAPIPVLFLLFCFLFCHSIYHPIFVMFIVYHLSPVTIKQAPQMYRC